MPPEQRRAQFVFWLMMLAATLVFTGLGFVLPEFVDIGLTEQLLRPVAISFLVIGVLMAAAAHILYRRVKAGYTGPVNLTILVWTFDESLASFGLVLAVLGFAPADWLPFNVVGAVLLLLHRPAFGQPDG